MFQAANATKGHVEEDKHDDDDEMVNGDVSRDLATDENIIDPIEDRRTLAERNERLHDQLKVRNIENITFDHDYKSNFHFTGLKTRSSTIAGRKQRNGNG